MTHTVEMLVAWVMKTGNLDYTDVYVGCLLRKCMILETSLVGNPIASNCNAQTESPVTVVHMCTPCL